MSAFPIFFTPLLARALLSIAFIIIGLGLYWIINHVILIRASRNSSNDRVAIPGTIPGIPAILYFTAPSCVPCKTVQRPALQRLKDRLGDCIQVIEVDAVEKPDLASRWGVLSVPTTFIIDSTGKLRHVNHGVTRSEKLLEQIISVH